MLAVSAKIQPKTKSKEAFWATCSTIESPARAFSTNVIVHKKKKEPFQIEVLSRDLTQVANISIVCRKLLNRMQMLTPKNMGTSLILVITEINSSRKCKMMSHYLTRHLWSWKGRNVHVCPSLVHRRPYSMRDLEATQTLSFAVHTVSIWHLTSRKRWFLNLYGRSKTSKCLWANGSQSATSSIKNGGINGVTTSISTSRFPWIIPMI